MNPTSSIGYKPASAQVYASGSTSLTITPNYAKNFGMVRFGIGPAGSPSATQGAALQNPTSGPGAQFGRGDVDFGQVETGADYIYEYAVQLHVNSASPFSVYGEATSDFTGSASLPIAQRLYWLRTSVGPRADGTTGDTNTTWGSASTPFAVNASPGNGAEPPIYSSSSTSVTLGYDFILRLADGDPPGSYGASVAYTVVTK